jgi:hypothetical protein
MLRVVMLIVAMSLVTIAGCKRVTSTRPDERDASMLDDNLTGMWFVSRTTTSEIPQPPRNATCPPFSTEYQPSTLTIVGTELSTDGGRPVGNVTLFGTHALTFSEAERWGSSEGIVEYVVLYYQLDRRSAAALEGTANTIATWPEGDCAYAWNVSAQRL